MDNSGKKSNVRSNLRPALSRRRKKKTSMYTTHEISMSDMDNSGKRSKEQELRPVSSHPPRFSRMEKKRHPCTPHTRSVSVMGIILERRVMRRNFRPAPSHPPHFSHYFSNYFSDYYSHYSSFPNDPHYSHWSYVWCRGWSGEGLKLEEET